MDKNTLFVLYAGAGDLSSVLDSDSGFELAACGDPDRCPVLTRRPDIVLMDPFLRGTIGPLEKGLAVKWLKAFKAKPFRFPPAFFIVVSPGTDMDDQLSLMEAGFDDIIEWPISPRMLGLRSRCLVKKTLVEQNLHSKDVAQEKLFGYLDRFKVELKKAKTDLRDEKNSLNTALKQIQEMTLERRRLKTGNAELKKLLKQNMDGFGKIFYTLIQHKLEKNRGHGERVARTALFIAKEMGFGEKKLEDLRKAAMLHEIGLLFLSDYDSDRPLDDIPGMAGTGIKPENIPAEDIPEGPVGYDKTLMVQFPVKGAQLLSHCPGFEDPARIIHSLNENSDGTGYPDGLRRRYIPLASKILAGADELEGLRDRDDIRGTDDLLKALENLAGVRLDPVIVGWLEKFVVLHMGADAFRVRGVGIEQLEPGMALGTALFTTTGTKLFTANTVLTRESIDKIIQYHREYPVDATVYIKA